MPPFRNPFNRRPAPLSSLPPVNDENARPGSANGPVKAADERPTNGASRTSSGVSIPKTKKEPDEFKMSGTILSPASQPITGIQHDAVEYHNGC